jgi:hypothetical protein
MFHSYEKNRGHGARFQQDPFQALESSSVTIAIIGRASKTVRSEPYRFVLATRGLIPVLQSIKIVSISGHAGWSNPFKIVSVPPTLSGRIRGREMTTRTPRA